MRSETRQISDGHFVKIAHTIEKDVLNPLGLGETFGSMDAELRRYLEDAFKAEMGKPQAEPVRDVSPLRTENPFKDLHQWTPSTKKKNLRTIRLTTQALNDPLVKELHDRLVLVGKLGLVVGDKKYTYWKTQDGTEFLSEWSKAQLG
jgi:hypothetical protein